MIQPVADDHDRTVRWRQLVDLLSRPHPQIDSALHDAALSMVRADFSVVAKPIRAATARSIAGRRIDARLLAIFAADRLEVAAPLLAAAQLDQGQWSLIHESASEEVAQFLRSLRGDPPILSPDQTVKPAEEPAETAEERAWEPSPSIGEMVARIERLKHRREGQEGARTEPAEPAQGATDSPVSPGAKLPAPSPGIFRWESDPSGQIGWVEGAPRGAMIGRLLPAEDGASRELARALTDRLPFADTPLHLNAPAVAGEWRVSGVPAFAPGDGRFLGFRGVARRESPPRQIAAAAQTSATPGDAEALRETIHEIKTPLNAIIGFAEIIDGQYLGPAHRRYRERASEIVAQARTLLTAIEDVDFAARRGLGGGRDEGGSELSQLLPPLVEELANRALSRDVRLRVATPSGALPCPLEAELVTRLLRRLLGAAVDAAQPGEQIDALARHESRRLLLRVSRPAVSLGWSEAQMVDPAQSPASETGAPLSLGFAMRLVRGLARLAGGDLHFEPKAIVLSLPGSPG